MYPRQLNPQFATLQFCPPLDSFLNEMLVIISVTVVSKALKEVTTSAKMIMFLSVFACGTHHNLQLL